MKFSLGRHRRGPPSCGAYREVRFRNAVPTRRDRRELRRKWRRAEREVIKEQSRTVAGRLRSLVARRSRLVLVIPERGATGVEFADGTRLRLRIRYSNSDLAALPSPGLGSSVPRLEDFERLGHGLFRLYFFTGAAWCRVEVLAQVSVAATRGSGHGIDAFGS